MKYVYKASVKNLIKYNLYLTNSRSCMTLASNKVQIFLISMMNICLASCGGSDSSDSDSSNRPSTAPDIGTWVINVKETTTETKSDEALLISHSISGFRQFAAHTGIGSSRPDSGGSRKDHYKLWACDDDFSLIKPDDLSMSLPLQYTNTISPNSDYSNYQERYEVDIDADVLTGTREVSYVDGQGLTISKRFELEGIKVSTLSGNQYLYDAEYYIDYLSFDGQNIAGQQTIPTSCFHYQEAVKTLFNNEPTNDGGTVKTIGSISTKSLVLEDAGQQVNNMRFSGGGAIVQEAAADNITPSEQTLSITETKRDYELSYFNSSNTDEVIDSESYSLSVTRPDLNLPFYQSQQPPGDLVLNFYWGERGFNKTDFPTFDRAAKQITMMAEGDTGACCVGRYEDGIFADVSGSFSVNFELPLPLLEQ